MLAAEPIRSTADSDLPLIREAARAAGEIALRYFKRNPQTWLKGGHSPVSEADYAVDRYLRETLTAARPDYGWLSEETADSPARLEARRTFVVDPIDGTRAFLDGMPTWCVSIAVVEDGEPLAGILDCAARGEVFEATAGRGAFRNGSPLQVGPQSASPLVAGPKSLFDEGAIAWPAHFRRGPYYPSLAYRLAMVASGDLDATFVKPNARDWDIAAADLILREAGGRLVDIQGNSLRYGEADPSHGALAAGSGVLLTELTAMMAAVAGLR
ncbi:3'(2'),5'-bisphosphate nucleotidase CysQ [Mesorhizobium sp. L-8-10]|uniref:3'(2'),5'-bisphosphate nucleotidase CysQ n=1 Tax=unclassified Mesorhizobium TaxID=325217 RepID=UPI00192742F9|nr:MULTISPECIES: 3'(2'),5'-bisphosphate nucleotidase CysQ [unclassified Mesorhizobium]BCH26557.1 3'(2'),5'-bisphosphate nucleotidase CysQ [Mesorhizobium sp. L-8-3]BCH34542.1 3'(2'),5'-bisphosphate nucleotidase CysQ [Mesorhizobium sp. L-8-10]